MFSFKIRNKKCVNYLTNWVILFFWWGLFHISSIACSAYSPPPAPPAVVLNSLWVFMAHDLCNYGYLSEVLCCKNTECKHYCIFLRACRGALAPPPLWPVGAHPHRLSGTFGFTVCENSLCWTQHSSPVTLVSRSSHTRKPPPSNPLRLAPAKAWPCREGRGHLAADATHWFLQLYRPSP